MRVKSYHNIFVADLSVSTFVVCAGAGGGEVSSGSAVPLSSTPSRGQSQATAGVSTLSP